MSVSRQGWGWPAVNLVGVLDSSLTPVMDRQKKRRSGTLTLSMFLMCVEKEGPCVMYTGHRGVSFGRFFVYLKSLDEDVAYHAVIGCLMRVS